MNKKLLSFLFFALFVTTSRAQRNLGVSTGDFSRINSMYLNPANLADSSEMLSVNLFSISVRVDNNLGTSGINSISKSLNSKNTDSGASSPGIFANSGRNKFSMILPEVNIHGPGIAVSINKKYSVALSTGVRIINQFSNFDQTLYNTISNTSSITSQNYTFNTQKFNWTAHMWNEIGLSFGGMFIDDGKNQLKAGITIKRLGGIGYVSLKGNNLDLNYYSGPDSFYATHTDLEFASNVINDSTAVFNGINASNLFSRFFGATAGLGIGGDIGVVYKRRLGQDVTDDDAPHDLVFSASVTDIGAIKYNRNSSAVINVSGTGSLTGKAISGTKNATDFINYMQQQGFKVDTSTTGAKVHLPTALILSADYQVYQRVYVNVLFLANLANRQNFGNSYYDQLTITPRYDFRLLSVALPVTYSALAHDVKVGFGFRFSGFFFGSDDLLAAFSNHQYGAGFYLGGYVPIKARKKHIDPATTPN